MGRTVVIAEKPSVGRDIARVLGCQSSGRGCLTGGDWVVTWAVGHLVTLVEPDELDEKYKRWSFDTLPILPAEIPLKVIASSRDQFAVVRNLINAPETDRLICATDAGREGELIFRYIYEKAACKKPFDRLWISSMTDEAIQEGFRAIRSGSDYDGLYRSAQCRSQADWLVGMNASRAFTLRYDALLSVGRVQTPTLAILVKRRKEIEDFKPEEYATVTADFGDYRGMYFREGLEPDTHIPKIDDAKALAAQIKNQSATVISAETTRRRDLPPQLYDLTSLQRDANRLLGFTADKTLKLAQSLYETRKALTYPRTDSRYLPPDMIPRVVQTMKVLPESYQALVPGALPDGKLPVSKRTIDETKVTDHHAILPTPKRINLDSLPEDERQLYDMVVRRMLTAFYPACEYDATKVITGVGEHQFRTNGRVVLQNGWRAAAGESAESRAREEKIRRRRGGNRPAPAVPRRHAHRPRRRGQERPDKAPGAAQRRVPALRDGNRRARIHRRGNRAADEGQRHRHTRDPRRHHRAADSGRVRHPQGQDDSGNGQGRAADSNCAAGAVLPRNDRALGTGARPNHRRQTGRGQVHGQHPQILHVSGEFRPE